MYQSLSVGCAVDEMARWSMSWMADCFAGTLAGSYWSCTSTVVLLPDSPGVIAKVALSDQLLALMPGGLASTLSAKRRNSTILPRTSPRVGTEFCWYQRAVGVS